MRRSMFFTTHHGFEHASGAPQQDEEAERPGGSVSIEKIAKSVKIASEFLESPAVPSADGWIMIWRFVVSVTSKQLRDLLWANSKLWEKQEAAKAARAFRAGLPGLNRQYRISVAVLGTLEDDALQACRRL